jgi:hypothetical protein
LRHADTPLLPRHATPLYCHAIAFIFIFATPLPPLLRLLAPYAASVFAFHDAISASPPPPRAFAADAAAMPPFFAFICRRYAIAAAYCFLRLSFCRAAALYANSYSTDATAAMSRWPAMPPHYASAAAIAEAFRLMLH